MILMFAPLAKPLCHIGCVEDLLQEADPPQKVISIGFMKWRGPFYRSIVYTHAHLYIHMHLHEGRACSSKHIARQAYVAANIM